LIEKTKNIKKRLSVKSTTENLSTIREFIRNLSLQVGFDESIANKITLAVDEACTNIIKHAYQFSNSGKINIYANYYNKKMKISITDQGAHFNSMSVPEPDLAKYYKEKRVGGLGIFLMKKLMDEVKYSQTSGNRNKVTLIKYLE
jgi:serine/threonine-protein kinase RsbW